MRKFVLAAATLIASSAGATPPLPGPPKLLVVISVDQLSGDLFDEYSPRFTGGLARLARGTVFRNGYQSHATTETCLGHSTILTGARPARTGIVGNVWFDPKAPRADKTIYCSEDESAPGTSSSKYKVSPVHLRVPTLGDLLKQRSPASLNVAVAGKDRSAVMMSGHSADQRWYPGEAGFVTDVASAPVPQSVTAINAAVTRALAASRPPLEPAPYCLAKNRVFPIQGGGKPVGAGTLARSAGDKAGFRASPESDGAVLALAAGLVQELKLGTDSAPDVLSIGLSATDYVGHTYGTGGQEMCLQLMELDQEIGDFLARLNGWGLDYAVVLTADHGGLDIPERLRAKGVADAAWIDPALSPSRVGQRVAAAANVKSPVIAAGGPAGDIYLDRRLQGADRTRALEGLLAAYRAHPQVSAVFSAAEIARTPIPAGDPARWSVLQRVRASFDAQRSGDLYVVLKPHIQPITDTSRYVSTHGSPWDYDRRVPIIFWRDGFGGVPTTRPAETVDIMPTLAAMLGLSVDRSTIDGTCLPNVLMVRCAS